MKLRSPKRFFISSERISNRNLLFKDNYENTIKEVVKNVSRRYNWISQRDFSISLEDLQQEVYLSLLVAMDKKLQKRNAHLSDSLFSSPAFINNLCSNRMKDILRYLSAQQRGSGREREADDMIYLDDVDEEFLDASLTDDGVLVEELLIWLSQFDYEKYIISEKYFNIFVDYFVAGLTQKEVLEKYELDYSQQELSSKLQKLGNIIMPLMTQKIEDLNEMYYHEK